MNFLNMHSRKHVMESQKQKNVTFKILVLLISPQHCFMCRVYNICRAVAACHVVGFCL